MRSFLAFLLITTSYLAFGQDSLVSKKFSFGGYGKEFGIGGVQLTSNRAMLFNITSNCVTGNCQHGLGMALISDNGQLVKSAAFGHAVNDFDVVEAYKSIDGHCMALGNSTNNTLILQKIDTNLNLLWNKAIALDPAVGSSGLYLYAATEIDQRHQVLYANQWFTFDQAGNTIRSKKYLNGFNATNRFDLSAIKKLSNNRYVIGGHICDVAGFDSDPFVMITDSLGAIIKSNKYKIPNSPYTDQISAIFVTSNNEILAFGHKYNDFFMLALDSNLAIKWAKTYTATGLSAYTHQVIQVNSNCFVVATSGAAFAIDAQGAVSWSKNINYGSGAKAYATDTCHFATYSTKTINNYGSGYWNKMDAQGNGAASITAPLALTASNVTFTTAVPNISDMGVATTSVTSVPFTVVASVKAVDSASVKIASTGDCGLTPLAMVNWAVEKNNINVFPNPVSNEINFDISKLDLSSEYEILVNDISGKILKQQYSKARITQIDISSLQSGIYFYKIKSKTGVVVAGKFVKE